MRAGGGKQKGGAFERKICVLLSLWVSHGEGEDLFWRSAMSGGRSTVGSRKGKDLRRQAGDVSAVSAEGCILTDTFYIECKHVKKLSFDSFVIKSKGPLFDYWDTAQREARLHGKEPMLIAKQNLLPTLVITRLGCMPCMPMGKVYDLCEFCLFEDMLDCPFSEKALPFDPEEVLRHNGHTKHN